MLSIVEFFSVDFRPVCNFHGPCLYQQVHQLRLVEVCAYLGCQIFEVQPGRGLASWMQLDGLRSFCGQSWNKSTNFSLDLANFDFQLPLFSSKKKTKKISKTFFNPAHQPGPGHPQAFLVVSGCVRDYPIDLVNFIRSARLNPLQVAAFLGEDFPMTPRRIAPRPHNISTKKNTRNTTNNKAKTIYNL